MADLKGEVAELRRMLEELEEHLDRWKIPKRAGVGNQRLDAIQRVRYLRNIDTRIVAETRAENERLRRQLEEGRALMSDLIHEPLATTARARKWLGQV